MEKGAFEQQIGNTFDRLRKMEQCASAFPEKHRRLLSVAMEELSVTLEALRVVGEELGRRQERLAQLASFPETNPNPVMEADFTGRFYYINPAAKELFPGIQTSGLEHPWLKGVEFLAEVFERKEKCFYVRELSIGESWYVQTIYYVFESKRFRLYGLDITERKRMENEINGSRSELEKRIQERTVELVKINEALRTEVAERKSTEEALRKLTHDLDKRIKEINCLYSTCYQVEKQYAQLEERLQSIVNLLPSGWQYPEITCARIVLKGNEYKTDNFRDTPWKQTSEIRGKGEKLGTVEVYYLEEKPAGDEGPFLKEERDLINSIAVELGEMISHMRADEELQKTANLIENAGFGVTIGNPASKTFEFVNPEFARQHGYIQTEMIGMPYHHVYAPESKAALNDYIHRADEEGQISYESRHVRKDGGVFPVLMNVRSVKDETGKVRYRVVFCQDISKMKEAEASLAEKSKLLEAFFTSSVTPLVILDRNFNFIRVNEAYAKSCSRDVSDFKGHNHFEFYPHEENENIFRQVVETKVPHQAIAKPFSFPDHPEWGTTYWNWTLTPLLDDKGEVEFLVFSLEDVTGRAQAQEAARAASLYARSLIEASLDPLVTISRAGKIMDVNKATELVTGVSREILIGSDFLKYFTEPEKARKGYQQVFQNGFVKDYPLAIRHNSGRVTEVLYNATLYRNEAGEIQGVFAAARDVTEHKEIESRIYATNALLGLFSRKETRKEYLDEAVRLVQSWTGCCCVGIRALDKKGFIPYESFVGFSREFWESENWLSIDRHQCACIRVITRKPDPQDASVMSPAGSFVCNNTVDFIEKLPQEEKSRFRGVCVLNGFLSVAVFPISYQNKVLGALHLADEKEGMMRPKTVEFIESMAPMIGEAINRFNLEDELRESEVRLRHLSSELINVQENERKRIALEIHDSLGQSLNAIKFKVSSAMQDLLNHKAKTGMKHFQDLVPIVQEGIEEARRLQMDLRPSILDDLGISATISWFCRQFQKTYADIQIEPRIDIDEETAPKSLKIVIYRVLQEAMNNIAKHSGASLVSLSLTQEKNRIALTIQDNGQGFDLSERLSGEEPQRGLGLTSMRERTELSGGTYTIESVKDKGTTIQISWPL